MGTESELLLGLALSGASVAGPASAPVAESTCAM
jgi:hypothetical protein